MLTLPWHKKRKPAANRLHTFLQLAPVTVAVLVTLFGILPMLVNAVAGLAQGAIPANGWLGFGEGYPLFQPPFWLLWIPGVIAFIFAFVSIPVSGAFPTFFWGARMEMVAVSFLGLLFTFYAASAYGGKHVTSMVTLTVVWVAAIGIIALRGLLGTLKLVPKSWR